MCDEVSVSVKFRMASAAATRHCRATQARVRRASAGVSALCSSRSAARPAALRPGARSRGPSRGRRRRLRTACLLSCMHSGCAWVPAHPALRAGRVQGPGRAGRARKQEARRGCRAQAAPRATCPGTRPESRTPGQAQDAAAGAGLAGGRPARSACGGAGRGGGPTRLAQLRGRDQQRVRRRLGVLVCVRLRSRAGSPGIQAPVWGGGRRALSWNSASTDAAEDITVQSTAGRGCARAGRGTGADSACTESAW